MSRSLKRERQDGGVVALAELNVGSRHDLVAVSALPVGHAWRDAGLDWKHVAALAGCFASLPPILVNRAEMTVIDGAHRVAAARRLGLHVIAVVWFEGTPADAFAEFLSRNAADGLAVTPADRRNGVVALLAAHCSWSDRRVAELCGVSPKLVSGLRREDPIEPGSSSSLRRVGRDGRTRPLQPGAMRGEIANALRDDPGASLRTIASRVGVSPETVRSVRKGMEAAGHLSEEQERPVVVAAEFPAIDRLLFLRQPQVVSTPWREDNAFASTDEGVSFVEWFDSTCVGSGESRVSEVPLSRVYEIAEDARRRARFWVEFAESLEQRARRRR